MIDVATLPDSPPKAPNLDDLATTLAAELLQRYFRQIGAAGGRASAANMTPAQRSERARNAVAAREAKRKKEAEETAKVLARPLQPVVTGSDSEGVVIGAVSEESETP